jgi:hypothetical protein
MDFNRYVKFLLEGGFRAPIDTKRPVKVPNMKNHGTSSQNIGNKLAPGSYSGFKGDRLNPSTSTLTFKLPRYKKKIKKTHQP